MDEKQRVESEWVLVVLSGILSIGVIVVDYLKFDVEHRFLMGGVVVIGLFTLLFIPLSLTCTLCTHGKRRLLACLFLLLALFFTYVFPQTALGIRLNFLVFREAREETVELYQKDVLAQTGPYEYMPQNRLLSHTGLVYVTSDEKIAFTLYRGPGKTIELFYTPNDGGVHRSETFSDTFRIYPRSYTNIQKFDTNWYVAYVER